MGVALAVASGKGGVGKTTLTANLALALCALGKSVIAVDGDMGMRSLDFSLGLQDKAVYDLADVCEGRVSPEQALVSFVRQPKLRFLAASHTEGWGRIDPLAFEGVVEQLKAMADVVILDCPAGVGKGFLCAAAAAERVLVVATHDPSSVRDAGRVAQLLDGLGKTDNRLVLNRYDPQLIKKGRVPVLDELIDRISLQLIAVVPLDDRLALGTLSGLPAVLDKRCKAAVAYRNLAKRILGKRVPLGRVFVNGKARHIL